MIDMSQLTESQLEGLMFATQLANAPIAAANAQLPEDGTPQPFITCKQYLTDRVSDMLLSWANDALRTKMDAGKQVLSQQSREVQQQVADLLGLPDVINPDLAPLE